MHAKHACPGCFGALYLQFHKGIINTECGRQACLSGLLWGLTLLVEPLETAEGSHFGVLQSLQFES